MSCRKVPIFWSGSFKRDISAVAKRIPIARSTAKQVDMRDGVPAVDVAGRHFISENDIRVVEYLAEDFLKRSANIIHARFAVE